ncbi:17726_t:CDS:2, partial [Cetraspora pellucida]
DTLNNKNKLYRIENIDFDILLDLINFFKIFKKAYNYLESSKNPTLDLVISWYKTLKKHCKISQHNNQIREYYSLIYEVNNIDSNDNNDDLYEESQKRLTKKLCKKSSRKFIDFSEYYNSNDNKNSLNKIKQYLAYKVSKDTNLDILK